jgi:phosphoglycolate phosphatase
MKNHTLIFDFDGTIADTFQPLINISNQLADEFKFKKVKPEEIHLMKDKTSQEIVRYLEIPFMKIPRIASKAREELLKDIHNIQLIEGIKDLLLQLKVLNRTIGIMSSNSEKNVKKFLDRHQCNIFDFIMTSPKIWGKNHSLRFLMKTHRCSPEEIIYIGDETRDIEAAKKVGIKVVAVTWGYNSKKSLEAHQPNFLVHTPLELLNLLTNS